ncbi:MAG TPA: endonuclease domain-containing protein [Allosphingosinicella sp.]|jgi:very-short-patch-repair endonuclease
MKKRWSTVTRARTLRREMSHPELKLWQVLRTRPTGLKFRRQHPVGRYVLDFYYAEERLEVDGEAHDMGSNPERDARRDRWLDEQGIRTLRFLASDVLADVNDVVMRILVECGRA